MMATNIDKARTFAIEAHGSQRYGNHPYAYHLDAVASILAPLGEEAQIVGYLHDVLEDTSTSIEELREVFGERIANCVSLVSDEPGSNRKERKLKTNKKLAQVTNEDRLALLVKAADRLANLRMSALGDAGSKLEMYRKEHPAFRQAAHRLGLCDELWYEMDEILSKIPCAEG
jgi:(p)ppGpp synthase/HD superfamily hydrolase